MERTLKIGQNAAIDMILQTVNYGIYTILRKLTEGKCVGIRVKRWSVYF
jgi:hypothetical protein